MAVYEIPLRSDVLNYKFSIDLESQSYTFSFHFNLRSSQWYFDLSNSDGIQIFMGLPVFVNQSVFSRFSNPLLPPGRAMFVDTSGQDKDPSQDDLGIRVLFLYAESNEVL